MNETELERLVVRLTGDATSYQRMASQAAQATQEVGQAMEVGVRRVTGLGRAVDGLGSRMSGFAGQMRAMAALESPFSILTEGIQRAGKMETLTLSFETLLGSAEKAKTTLKELEEFAAKTPFAMPEVVEAARQMIAFGSSAETIVPTMRMLGDVSKGMGLRLADLVFVFGSLKSQGRAFTADITQFARRGIPIWQQLEKQFGKTNEEVRKMVEDGKVGFKEIEKAFMATEGPMAAFRGGMDKSSKGLEGMLSEMGDHIGKAKEAIGAAAIEAFHLKDAIAATGQAAQAFTAWFTQLNPAVKTAATVLAGLVLSLGAAAVAWKVGSLAVGGAIGTYQHVAATVPWVVRGTWEWVKALGSKTIAIQASIPVMTGYASSVAFTTSTLGVSTTTLNTNTGAIVANEVAQKAATRTNWSAVVAARALHATLAVAAVAGVLYLTDALTGGIKKQEEFDAALAKSQARFAEGQAAGAEKHQKFVSALTGMTPEERKAALDKEIADLETAKKHSEAISKSLAESRHGDLGRAGGFVFRNIPGIGREAMQEFDRLTQDMKNTEQGAIALSAQLQALVAERAKLADGEGGMVPKSAIHGLGELEQSLEKQIETYGMTKREIQIYELTLAGATDAHLSAVRSMNEMLDALDREKEKVKEVVRAEEEAVKTMDSMFDRGADIEKGLLTPTEKYMEAVAELDHLLYLGAIGQETYARATAEAKKKLDEADKSARSAKSSVQALDATLSGSSESRRRLQAHISATLTNALGVRRGGESGLGNERANGLLAQISDATRNLAERTVAVVEASF